MPQRRGRKSASQTPAPKADKIFGSKKNPKESASSENAAKKIVLSQPLANTLKRKLEDFKKKYPKSDNVSFEDLKAVYRRGTGAYSATHRPTISGGAPNSRSAWGIARVNKFLEKAAGEKVKKAYVQDDDLLKYKSGGLIAPNGKKSNLTPEQYKLVRTSAFKKWFGDWENDAANASKVVDENGEPLVVYHGTNKNFWIFSEDFKGSNTPDENTKFGFFFSRYKDEAKVYMREAIWKDTPEKYDELYGARIIEVFLAIKNPLKVGYAASLNVGKINGLLSIKNDGIIDERGDYIAFNPNQIKLADASNTTFDASNPDIRFEDGGLVHSLEMAMTNLKKNGIVIKHDGITLIAYNTGNQERQPSLYRKAIMYNSIQPKKQAAEIIEKFDKGQYENFDKNKIEEYKNYHLIIINQNEVIYDSNKPNMMYKEGGKTEKQIALPDTYATPTALKRVLNNQGYDLIDKNLKSDDDKKEIMDFKNDLTVSDIDHKYPNVSHPFINQQLMNGIKVEMEHADNPEIARKIALDHLHENINYYEYLEKMEAEMERQAQIDEHFDVVFARGGATSSKVDPIFSFVTPTGEPSKLNYIQQVLIRTSRFKKFFGDWETAAKMFLADDKNNFDRHYEDVSKIVDHVTLEPRLVFHGTMTEKEFYQFDVTREKGVGRPYAYFAFNKEYSQNFTTASQRGENDPKPFLYQVFLNVRNPFYALGKDFENKKESAEHWLELISERIYFDKYKKNQKDAIYNAVANTVNGQIGGYVKKAFPNGVEQTFWRLMSFDVNKDFKYFLIAYGYDGVIYDEELSSIYDVNNPAQYTKAVTIFDARQVKLADGRNTDFDSLSTDIRFDNGGKLEKPAAEHIKEYENDMNKKEKLEKMMFGGTFSDGGKVKGDNKMHHDAKDGGFFVGKSHADGGIKAINKDTGQIIEVEGNEVIINKRSVADTTKREFEGEMLTNREILSRINEAGGGVSFEDGGQLSCSGKKYKFGGETKEDFVIIYEISQSKEPKKPKKVVDTEQQKKLKEILDLDLNNIEF